MSEPVPKFKVGDRVVFPNHRDYLPWTFEVTRVTTSPWRNEFHYYLRADDKERSKCLDNDYESNLELESVYNSPLYKALK